MRSTICALGLLVFAPSLVHNTWIALLVIANGLQLHLSGSQSARHVDVATNTALILFVNITTNWFPTHVLTMIAVTCWHTNREIPQPRASVLHVLFVQLPLAIALYNY